MRVEWVPIRSILELQRRAVEVQPDAVYQEIGVRSFGKGLFTKDALVGAELGDKRVFYVRAGDFIVSNVFAWEGAVGVAGPEHEGLIGSHRFMTWTPPRDDVNVDYLRHYFGSEAGVASLGHASPGSAGRNRTLSIKNFERIVVPLPSRPDQDRVAGYLASLTSMALRSRVQPENLADPLLTAWLDSLPQRPLNTIAEVAPRPARVDSETQIDFVPMEAVDATTGVIKAPVLRRRGDLVSGYRQFLPGDVIFARITPCMQNGKTAIYAGVSADIGYGSTEFHVVRPRDRRHALWLWALMRTHWFISRAMGAFAGTAGQQRVPAAFLEQVVIPVPESGQLESGINHLLNFRDRVNELNDVARLRDHLASAILPAGRNEIFNSMR